MQNVEQGGMSRECILKIKVNPNTTFYSYYFFPRAPRSDFEVLFLSFFLRGWKSDESDMSDRSELSD